MKPLLLSLIFFGTVMQASSQFADSLKKQFIADWTRSRAYTDEYLAIMPESQFRFRPQDSIRSFAQQMLHLAQGTVSLMAAATGRKIPSIINRTNLEQTATAWSKDSVTFFVNLSYDYAIAAVREFDMLKAFEREARGSFNETRLAWMLKSFEHQSHHRGQTTIYIRMSGIRPPDEKIF